MRRPSRATTRRAIPWRPIPWRPIPWRPIPWRPIPWRRPLPWGPRPPVSAIQVLAPGRSLAGRERRRGISGTTPAKLPKPLKNLRRRLDYFPGELVVIDPKRGDLDLVSGRKPREHIGPLASRPLLKLRGNHLTQCLQPVSRGATQQRLHPQLEPNQQRKTQRNKDEVDRAPDHDFCRQRKPHGRRREWSDGHGTGGIRGGRHRDQSADSRRRAPSG